MKETEWWVVKVYSTKEILKGESRIDLWESFPSRCDAERYVRNNGPDTPFSVAKVTTEILRTKSLGSRKNKGAAP